MADKKNLKSEELNDEELENVAGGVVVKSKTIAEEKVLKKLATVADEQEKVKKVGDLRKKFAKPIDQ